MPLISLSFHCYIHVPVHCTLFLLSFSRFHIPFYASGAYTVLYAMSLYKMYTQDTVHQLVLSSR
jgi:hypothetical protein